MVKNVGIDSGARNSLTLLCCSFLLNWPSNVHIRVMINLDALVIYLINNLNRKGFLKRHFHFVTVFHQYQ